MCHERWARSSHSIYMDRPPQLRAAAHVALADVKHSSRVILHVPDAEPYLRRSHRQGGTRLVIAVNM